LWLRHDAGLVHTVEYHIQSGYGAQEIVDVSKIESLVGRVITNIRTAYIVERKSIVGHFPRDHRPSRNTVWHSPTTLPLLSTYNPTPSYPAISADMSQIEMADDERQYRAMCAIMDRVYAWRRNIPQAFPRPTPPPTPRLPSTPPLLGLRVTPLQPAPARPPSPAPAPLPSLPSVRPTTIIDISSDSVSSEPVGPSPTRPSRPIPPTQSHSVITISSDTMTIIDISTDDGRVVDISAGNGGGSVVTELENRAETEDTRDALMDNSTIAILTTITDHATIPTISIISVVGLNTYSQDRVLASSAPTTNSTADLFVTAARGPRGRVPGSGVPYTNTLTFQLRKPSDSFLEVCWLRAAISAVISHTAYLCHRAVYLFRSRSRRSRTWMSNHRKPRSIPCDTRDGGVHRNTEAPSGRKGHPPMSPGQSHAIHATGACTVTPGLRVVVSPFPLVRDPAVVASGSVTSEAPVYPMRCTQWRRTP
ncbi:hypothetical protein RHS04_06566, partial [Rhizoctonia solani]